ncbi:MAG: NUDIX hydrolase [Lautropia sp.]|nr:NUDIX hydrolase [Lautropia sp.]
MAFSRFFHDLIGFRPYSLQVAALCLRGQVSEREVLLVTSRASKRNRQWILPKGNPIAGLDLHHAAEREAWEEAGARGKAHPQPIGSYLHIPPSARQFSRPVEVHIFQIDEPKLSDDFPEARQRKRRWMNLHEAAGTVQQPELAALLHSLSISS